jgi:hypothetical protein
MGQERALVVLSLSCSCMDHAPRSRYQRSFGTVVLSLSCGCTDCAPRSRYQRSFGTAGPPGAGLVRNRNTMPHLTASVLGSNAAAPQPASPEPVTSDSVVFAWAADQLVAALEEDIRAAEPGAAE